MSIRDDPKRAFLLREFALLSVSAALATRRKAWPVYSTCASSGSREREQAKQVIYSLLEDVAQDFSATQFDDESHFRYLETTASAISCQLKSQLHAGRMRIGVTQKLVNLHLKYLWVAGYCTQPPHCPIDGIIRDRAQIQYDWTRSDDISEYQQAIAELREVAGAQSLAQWELVEFDRRRVRPVSPAA